MIRWRDKILLAKIETTYATDATPTGAANAILATEVSLNPMEGEDVSRELERPFLGAQPTIPVDVHATLSFRVELVGSGTAGTPPGWGPLLRACGCAETVNAGTDVVYNPVSDAHEAVSIYLWIGGTRYVLLGTRGTATFRVNASGIPYIEFQFTGLFTQPSETAKVTPDVSAFQKPQVASNANTPVFLLAGTALVMRAFSMNLGNAVEGRFLIGSEDILITDRADQIEVTVNAVPLTTLNPYQLAADQTDVVVALTHGVGAGRISSLAVPKAQMQRPSGLENSQGITEWPLRLVPQPDAGNDQWTLTLT
ncbi:phage tail tube protein [Litorisediminicola beolgyonensis]|uniref:Phage tail tube protein n=1 Tax=Litorisediminicola beolgyonensis TaxID=1173614 RepID=A0ABW3ZI99_9RHOB